MKWPGAEKQLTKPLAPVSNETGCLRQCR